VEFRGRMNRGGPGCVPIVDVHTIATLPRIIHTREEEKRSREQRAAKSFGGDVARNISESAQDFRNISRTGGGGERERAPPPPMSCSASPLFSFLPVCVCSASLSRFLCVRVCFSLGALLRAVLS
jgi:hypothetical protein